MWYPGRFGYAFTKALTTTGSLGGSKLNRKGTGWKTNGTSWSLDGGEFASGVEHTVISGTRVMPSRSFARVLASSVRLGLTRRGEVTPTVASGARVMSDMSPGGVPASSTHSGATANKVPPPTWPWLPRLRLLRRGGWRGRPECSSSAVGRCCRRARRRRTSRRLLLSSRHGGKEYHVVAVVEGHELETPEAEHRPGLERLLKTPHLELNRKMFVNTQQAPTWRANCRRLGPRGSLGSTSEIAACPCPDGLARDGTQEVGQALYYPAPRVSLAVGVTSASCERGRDTELIRRSPHANPPQGGPGSPFYRGKERVQTYNGGRSYPLTCPAVECLSPVYMPTWPLGESLGPVHVMAWPSEERLSPVGAQLAARRGSC
jgi:hypothetical protein